MSKQLKIKHAIIITIISVILIGCGLGIYFLQTENQDLKTQQDSTIKVTETKTEECTCLETKCEDGETTTETQYSTLTGLFTQYTVEYPLGWHVIDSGLEYFAKDEIDTLYVHFNNTPITQVPRGGQPGVIALIDQTGQIPTFENFLTEKKDLFQNLTEESSTTDSGLTYYKLSGQTLQFEQWVEDVIYCLEYNDSVGDRHVVYTSLQTDFEDTQTSTSHLETLEHIIKTFKANE